jgi:outer membrane biosynthesis protein TonB
MKAGLVTSVCLHALLLGLGLFTLSAPSALEVADVESLPVDIIPIEEVTNIQQGEKTATVKEKPAPLPTKRPDIVPEAQKVGENTVDTEKPPTPEAKPKPVETAAAPPPAPEPKPKPVEKPKEAVVEKPVPKPEPVPTPEVAAEPKPKQEVTPDPVAEQIVAEKADAPAEEVQLPSAAPAPQARPPTPKAQTAQTPERKVTEQKTADASAKPASTEKDFNADEVAALLDKQKPSGGGAKRSTEQASLGGDKTTGGSKLSQSEMDALRGQVQKCWNVPAGALDGSSLKVSVKFKLDQTGTLEGTPEIISGGGATGVERAAAEAAKRAVSRCSPYNLPADKYDAWADVIVNFDPSEMY